MIFYISISCLFDEYKINKIKFIKNLSKREQFDFTRVIVFKAFYCYLRFFFQKFFNADSLISKGVAFKEFYGLSAMDIQHSFKKVFQY